MGIAVLCVYAGVLVHLSRRSCSRNDAASSFFVNDRASGGVGVALSLIVSCVGASATMGMAGMAFSIGTPAFWWLGAGAAGLTLLAVLLAAKVRESACFTMPEMIERLLGPAARRLISLVILVAWTAILAAQFSALEKLLAALTGWTPAMCLAGSLLLIVVHTMGGQAVIMRTDRLQFFVLMGGLGALLLWLHANNPGWAGRVRLEAVNSGFSFSDLFRYLFVVGGNYLVCPMLFGRFLSARNASEAKRGGLLAAFGLLGCAVMIVAVGLSCRGLLAPDTPPDAVLTTAISTVFPGWLAVLVLLALISAVVSSADSYLVTSSTVLSYDLLRTRHPAYCRLSVVALGLLGAAMTFMDRGILSFLLMAYDVYVAGVVMPVFVAMVALRGRAVPSAFGVTAIVCGGLMGGIAAIWEVSGMSVAGMVVSALVTLAGVLYAKQHAVSAGERGDVAKTLPDDVSGSA